MVGTAGQSAGVSAEAPVDIWNTSDQFRLVYRTLTSDVEIVAYLSGLQQTDVFRRPA